MLVDLQTGTRTLESLDVVGNPLPDGVLQADLTDDASQIVFSSYSDATLAFGFSYSRSFLRTRADSSATTAITGAGAVVAATEPTIDGDGSHIAARVDWNMLQGLGSDYFASVAVLDVDAGTWQLASRTALGERINGDVQRPTVSADGSTVGFTTYADDLPTVPAGTLNTWAVYTYEVTGLAPADGDGDGIMDTVDGTLPGEFLDTKTAPDTFGRITQQPVGMTVTITDAPDPDGVLITTASGSGFLRWQMCGIPMTLSMGTNSSAIITCGSAITEVVEGQVIADLGDGTTITMPAGSTTRVAEVPGSTALTVEVQENTSITPVLLSKDGVTAQVGTTPISVQAWRFTGFAQPIDNAGVLNAAKGGSVVPVKWRVTRGGVPVTTITNATITYATKACPGTSVPVDEIETVVSMTSTLLNHGNGNYQLNWRTPTTKGCGELRLDIGDGVRYTAQFRIR